MKHKTEDVAAAASSVVARQHGVPAPGEAVLLVLEDMTEEHEAK